MHHPVNIPLSFILDPAMIVDRKGRFLQCNPATFDQTGYDLQALQQMTAADLLHPADTRRARLELLKVIRNGQSRAFEGQIRSGPETYAWVRINAHLLSNTPGAETALVIARDISAEKARELELRRAQRQAELASKAKSRYISTLNHELRTPLNSIIQAVHLLDGPGEKYLTNKLEKLSEQFSEHLSNERLREVADKSSDAPTGERLGDNRALHVIRLAATHMRDLVNDALSIARIEAGELQLQPRKMNLKRTIEEVIELNSLSRPSLDFRIAAAPDVPNHFTMDQKVLRQVLTNLVANAVRYTDAGSVTVRYAWENRCEGSLRFEVRDTGMGIPEYKLNKIFNAFEQVSPGSERALAGTGLGLTIVRRLVRLMGGEIRAQSQPGHGSTFTFTIQAQPCRQWVQEKANGTHCSLCLDNPDFDVIAANPVHRHLLNKSILIIDDDPISRELLHRRLQREGFVKIRTAGNGILGLQIAAHEAPDIVMLDQRIFVKENDHVLIHIRLKLANFRFRLHPGAPRKKFLYIDWLMTANPRARNFRPERLFPGQDLPGLGIFNQLSDFIANLAIGVGARGAFNIPEYFHDAMLFHRQFNFYDPLREAFFRAVIRDLRHQGARRISRAFSEGRILDLTGKVIEWTPGEMLSILSPEVEEMVWSREYFTRVVRELKRIRIRMLDESEKAPVNPTETRD